MTVHFFYSLALSLFLISSWLGPFEQMHTNNKSAARLAVSIENVEDLAKQSIIPYGCKEGGSTCSFFKVIFHPFFSPFHLFFSPSFSFPLFFYSSHSPSALPVLFSLPAALIFHEVPGPLTVVL